MAKKDIIKKTINIELSIDAVEVRNKYPNYRFNFGSPEEFIDFLKENIKSSINGDMDKWGFDIKIKK